MIVYKAAPRIRLPQNVSLRKSFNPSAVVRKLLEISVKEAEGFKNQTLHKCTLAALACTKVYKNTFGCSRHSPSQLGFCSRLHKSTAPFSWGSVHTYLCGLQLRRLKFQSLGLNIQCRRLKNQLRRLKNQLRRLNGPISRLKGLKGLKIKPFSHFSSDIQRETEVG